MNLIRTLGGSSSKFCESPLSSSDSSLSIVISCMLNVSLKSIFLAAFVLVGKNGDENSSSSLLNFEWIKTWTNKIGEYLRISKWLHFSKYVPVIRFVFNKWKSMAWNGQSIDRYQTDIVAFCFLLKKHKELWALVNFCKKWKKIESYGLIASILFGIVLFGTFHFQLQFTLKCFAWCVFIRKSAAIISVYRRRSIIIWILSKKYHFHIVVRWIACTDVIVSACWL